DSGNVTGSAAFAHDTEPGPDQPPGTSTNPRRPRYLSTFDVSGTTWNNGMKTPFGTLPQTTTSRSFTGPPSSSRSPSANGTDAHTTTPAARSNVSTGSGRRWRRRSPRSSSTDRRDSSAILWRTRSVSSGSSANSSGVQFNNERLRARSAAAL